MNASETPTTDALLVNAFTTRARRDVRTPDALRSQMTAAHRAQAARCARRADYEYDAGSPISEVRLWSDAARKHEASADAVEAAPKIVIARRGCSAQRDAWLDAHFGGVTDDEDECPDDWEDIPLEGLFSGDLIQPIETMRELDRRAMELHRQALNGDRAAAARAIELELLAATPEDLDADDEPQFDAPTDSDEPPGPQVRQQPCCPQGPPRRQPRCRAADGPALSAV